MDALIQFIEDWERARDQKKAVHAVFFDFAKAFESVDHQVLMTLVVSLIPNWLTSWIAAYLSNRQQRVKIGKITSSWDVFIIYINHLFIISINEAIPSTVELIKYADDLLKYIIMDTTNNQTIQQTVDSIFK
jgi:hypothetical protein